MARSVCVIPSRAGTKNKGLWYLNGKCLVEWALKAAGDRQTIVATDQDYAVSLASTYSAEVFWRDATLADGDHMIETLVAVADKFELVDDTIMHVCQPSSPFLRAQDLRTVEEVFSRRDYWSSVQTVIPIPHNFHEFNQREFGSRGIAFVHRGQRLIAKTKQDKPSRWAFGNLVSVLVGKLRRQKQIFAIPSYGEVISRWYGLDVDDLDDLKLAEAYLAQGLVTEKELRA